MSAIKQELEQKRQQLDTQKLIIAARIRVHNEINFKESNGDENASKIQNKQNKANDNVSQAGTLKSRTFVQSNSSITSSQTSLTNKTGKTGNASQSQISTLKKGVQKKKKEDNRKVNLYASEMNDKNILSQIVNLNPTPLSYSLLQKYLKNDNNILTQKDTLLPKSKQFQFDICFSQETSQQEIYEALLQKKIKTVLNGFQTSIFIIGSEFSGRKYTIRGDENIMNKNSINERGLMVRACEDILSLIDISKESIRSRKAIVGGVYYNLGVQIYCVKDDAEVDLLVNAPEQLLNKNNGTNANGNAETEMGCFDVTSVQNLLLYYRQAQNRFNMIHDTLKGQDFNRNATIFIRLLILKNKQIYSSVNFGLLFNFDLLNQQRFYPVRDYLREVEKMQKRQLKTYSFNNKTLLHINKCFSSGPEFNAVILGQFDSNPSQIENAQQLLQILSTLRQTNNSKGNKKNDLQLNLKNKKGVGKNGNQNVNENEQQQDEEQEQDQEVQAFILNSNRKSSGSNGKSELNETAGFNAIQSAEDQIKGAGNDNHQLSQSLQSFQYEQNEPFDQQRQQGQQEQGQNQSKRQSNENNQYEQNNQNQSKVKKFNTFGNENGQQQYNNNNNDYEDEQQQNQENDYDNENENEQSYKISPDVETAIRDIFSYSDATKGMNESQRLKWVKQQERNLEHFNSSINFLKPPLKGSNSDLLFKKYIQAKAFLNDLKGELDIKEQVRRNLDDGDGDDDGQYDDNQKMYQSQSSSSSGIDTRFYLNRNNQDEQFNRSNERFRSDSYSDRNLNDMKRKIMDQIDKTIQQSPVKSKKTNQFDNGSHLMSTHDNNNNNNNIDNQSQSQTNLMNNGLTSVSKRYNTTDQDFEDDQHQSQAGQPNIRKNLYTLRNQIIEKEKLQEETSFRMKNKSQLLNDEVDMMRQRLIVMQDAIKSRDRAIADYELQLADVRQNQSLINSNYPSQSRKLSRETLLERAQEDMHNNILHFKNKLSLRKTQIAELKEEIKRMEMEYGEERRRLIEERVNFEKIVEEYREKVDQERFKSLETERLLDKARIELQNRDVMTERLQSNTSVQDKTLTELQYRLNQEQDLSKELRIQNQLQEKKIIEYEKHLSHYEDKIQKQKRKFEEERTSLNGEKKREQERRKEKIANLKKEVKNLDRKVNELTNEGLDIRTDNDRLSRTIEALQDEIALKNQEISSLKENNLTLREDLDTLKHSYRDSDLLMKREQQEYKKLEREIKRLKEELTERDERIIDWQNQLNHEREQYNIIEQEYHHQVETNRQQQDLITKIERQNEFLSSMQNRDIDKLEERVDSVNNEVNVLRKECDSLRLENTSLRSDIQLTDRDANLNKEKIYKYKKQVSVLKQSLAEADDKLRELIYQKHNEIRQIQSPQQDDDYY